VFQNWFRIMYNKSNISWVLYDFANSAYHLLIITVLFPICFKQALYANHSNSDAIWSVVVSLPILLSGVLSPFIGAYIDEHGAKKRVFITTCIATILLTFGLSIATQSVSFIPVLIFSLSIFFFNISDFVYNAFLPTQTFRKGFAFLSGLGWGIGYLGGILCMPLAFLFIRNASLPDDYASYQKAFCVVAAYFLIFALPSLIYVKDEIGNTKATGYRAGKHPWVQVLSTLKSWKTNREIFKFLFAFYLINDGLSTLVFFTSIFASTSLSMSTNQIMKAFLIVQAVGIPATILLCWLAERIGYKTLLLVCVLIWVGNAIGFLFVRSSLHLYILSVTVGFVIGSTPAMARAILALMVSNSNVSEIYGLHALTGRISAIIGPLLFGVVSSVTGSQTMALSSLTVFFVGGFAMLIVTKIPSTVKHNQT